MTTTTTTINKKLHAFVSWPNAPLTRSLVLKALESLNQKVEISTALPTSFDRLLQWSTYDDIDHELTHHRSDTIISSSYTIRKALTRKHFLSRCIHSYLVKHTDSSLKLHVPRTWDLEISFADDLDELWTDELWDLGQKLDADTGKWYILKPGMADRGMGIRLFNSKDTLQRIFEGFEEASDDEVELEETNSTAVVTSQLRHFVIQEYLSCPLLLDPRQVPLNRTSPPSELQGHKFHLRAYCVCSGALKVFLYTRILALFSSKPYDSPSLGDEGQTEDMDLAPHLTNTSLQLHTGEESVRLLEELNGCTILSGSKENSRSFTEGDIANILQQMAATLTETFRAALESPVHFQPLPNAFELYGIDFLVSDPSSSELQVQLLEINAEPAIELTGPRLTWILEDLFVNIAKTCIEPSLSGAAQKQDDWVVRKSKGILIKCLDQGIRGCW
ncbi:TTL-domain-containing protein [Pleurotus eryngii]|uniref:TTL-domain-containing protein n=1 Tax=Pleurotus eryngii TaxID=5323 RepID=A0A9P6DJ13_PLEER|nr:TTL-domain-containing protein [Pleurotus eryngii]